MTDLHHDDDHEPAYWVPEVRRVVWVWRAALLCGLMLIASAVYTYGIVGIRECSAYGNKFCPVYYLAFFVSPSMLLAVFVTIVAVVKWEMLARWVRLSIVVPPALIVGTLLYFVFFAGRS